MSVFMGLGIPSLNTEVEVRPKNDCPAAYNIRLHLFNGALRERLADIPLPGSVQIRRPVAEFGVIDNRARPLKPIGGDKMDDDIKILFGICRVLNHDGIFPRGEGAGFGLSAAKVLDCDVDVLFDDCFGLDWLGSGAILAHGVGDSFGLGDDFVFGRLIYS